MFELYPKSHLNELIIWNVNYWKKIIEEEIGFQSKKVH